MKAPETLLGLAAAAAAAFALFPVAADSGAWPVQARDFLAATGAAETGAGNLVSAVYLGYRAYDTVGETIVLLVALTGALGIIGHGASASSARAHSHASASASAAAAAAAGGPRGAVEGKPEKRRQRTAIIETTAGKLAPVVLLFGCYVMFFGHRSPGGGFQGGVVLASGIVFIAIGRKDEDRPAALRERSPLSRKVLERAEAAAFAAILLLCLAGAFGGTGILGNPFAGGGAFPPVAFIVAFNMAIGAKVAAGISAVCLAMIGEDA